LGGGLSTSRPGDNLYTNSLLALDAATGQLVWFHQFVPHDVHDYDVSHVAPVFKTAINGSTHNVIASTARGRLTAFDASTGHERWRYDAAKPLVAGVTTTDGDLVFTGELTGDLLALDARSGKVLLQRDLGGPAAGGVVTYGARGVQNVAVVSGFVGVYNLVAPEIGGGNTTVTVFRLPEK
jgi:glucose dehydrogenase